MSFASILLLLASVSASVGGQFFLKQGALQLGEIDSSNVGMAIVGMLSKWQIWVGLTCYGLGVITYILLLNKVNLSVASPLLATSYIFAVLLGVFFFKESVSIAQYIGIGMIFCGAILLSQGKPG
ncbi:EamA family transporter [filamentous cyanobacterium LEGE 11480]|uniref:EamA family transporter n=1 Tax=Romeriopsis navalis LEGE 11480 TaxID=2777977 RepID=A0A928VP12_9CYAN|nr:EamA family transporter [Romeriopsis navalis]MBE9031193.1 EamA family transporter [Romeriopsis navalis LEGE 11480]